MMIPTETDVSEAPDSSEAVAPAPLVPSASESQWHSTLRALRHRNYRLFLIGQFISLIGTWMESTAVNWLVSQLTRTSPYASSWLGMINFVGLFPAFVLAPIGGSLADIRSRRGILVATQTVAMVLSFILAALTLSGHVELWHVFLIGGLLGVVNGFDIPTRQAFLIEMVGREDLMNAIALNSSMFNAARIVGPAVAAVAIHRYGEGWCFALNGLSFLAVILCLVVMELAAPTRGPSRGGSAFEHLTEGFRFAASSPPIRALLLLVGLLSLMGMPYTVLMPNFALDVLKGDERVYGLLLTATGLGAMLGAFSLTFRKGVIGLGRWIVASFIGFGLIVTMFAFSRNIWLSCAALVPAGFCLMVGMGACNTLIQSMVPDHLRGRVSALFAMMFMGMSPFGGLLSGWLADHIGLPWTICFNGAMVLLGGVVFAMHLPSLRAEGRKLLQEQDAARAAAVAES
jgi:MFS family permease